MNRISPKVTGVQILFVQFTRNSSPLPVFVTVVLVIVTSVEVRRGPLHHLARLHRLHIFFPLIFGLFGVFVDLVDPKKL